MSAQPFLSPFKLFSHLPLTPSPPIFAAGAERACGADG